jgi:hypothetical protein
MSGALTPHKVYDEFYGNDKIRHLIPYRSFLPSSTAKMTEIF